MAKAAPKIVLSPSRDIPFDKLILSQSNIRRVKNGVTIENLADSIARRSLLHGLNVRPLLDDDGNETGFFEVPAGGRRYSALALLVKRRLFAKTGLVPCVVKAANDPVLAEEDSLAENSEREPLHPLDEFHGMKVLVDKGEREEAIAAHWHLTGQDVIPVLGQFGSDLWNRLVVPTDPKAILYAMEYRVEAGSVRKPNREKKAQNAKDGLQTLFPFFQQLAMMGITGPYNALIKDWGDSIDLNTDAYMLNLPPPAPAPQPGAAPPSQPPQQRAA